MRDSRDVAIPSMHKDEAAALSSVKVGLTVMGWAPHREQTSRRRVAGTVRAAGRDENSPARCRLTTCEGERVGGERAYNALFSIALIADKSSRAGSGFWNTAKASRRCASLRALASARPVTISTGVATALARRRDRICRPSSPGRFRSRIIHRASSKRPRAQNSIPSSKSSTQYPSSSRINRSDSRTAASSSTMQISGLQAIFPSNRFRCQRDP